MDYVVDGRGSLFLSFGEKAGAFMDIANSGRGRVHFLVPGDDGNDVQSLCMHSGSLYTRTGHLPYRDVRALNVVPEFTGENYFVKPGSRFTFWGVR